MIVTIVLLHNDNIYHSTIEMGQEISIGSHKKDDVYVGDFSAEQIVVKWKKTGFSVNAKKAYNDKNLNNSYFILGGIL